MVGASTDGSADCGGATGGLAVLDWGEAWFGGLGLAVWGYIYFQKTATFGLRVSLI